MVDLWSCFHKTGDPGLVSGILWGRDSMREVVAARLTVLTQELIGTLALFNKCQAPARWRRGWFSKRRVTQMKSTALFIITGE